MIVIFLTVLIIAFYWFYQMQYFIVIYFAKTIILWFRKMSLIYSFQISASFNFFSLELLVLSVHIARNIMRRRKWRHQGNFKALGSFKTHPLLREAKIKEFLKSNSSKEENKFHVAKMHFDFSIDKVCEQPLTHIKLVCRCCGVWLKKSILFC